MSQKRRILVTAALPYANGDIHIGHIVEYTLADFWSRFQKMRGHDCAYICADDTHGTPIMISARKQGITPEQLIERAADLHLKDFNAFEIQFDYFGSTNSPTNRKLVEEFFAKMKAKNHIVTKSVEQAYCEHDKMFLPDRLIVGTCPKCKAEDQYGDSCDVCSATYNPLDMKNARCSICGTPPVSKETEHLFFRLNDFRDMLQSWVHEHTAPEVARKLDEWFKEDLREWTISRDAPYFGFEIPGHPGKFFYVWVDAPVGYIAATKEWCEQNKRDFNDFWRSKDAEIYHIIGKDIIYFHALFWPAMLETAEFSKPTKILAHGMLTVNGAKMSKSKGTSIKANTYLKHLDPVYLRYYYACKMTGGIEDIDLNLTDFVTRVNSDLIGKITNVASRGASMLHRLDGHMGTLDAEGAVLLKKAQGKSEAIAALFEEREFAKAMQEIREIADDANKYFDQHEPWKLVKQDEAKTKQILTSTLNLFRVMAIYLKPIIPSYVARVEALFGEKPYQWQDAQKTLQNHPLQPFTHLLQRIDPKKVEELVEDSKQVEAPAPKAKTPAADQEPLAATIDIGVFNQVDLRVAKIVNAAEVAGADKLLQLTLDLGFEQRNVFAGIKSAYKAEDLVGRLTVMVANLQPRKMKFGMSEGMVLAAGPGGKEIHILSPDSGAKPGDRIH